MEAQTALIRSDSTVHLYTEAAVDVQHTLIILPGDTENDRTLRLHHTLKDLLFFIFRILLENRHNRRKYLTDGILEFLLLCILYSHLV